MSLWQSELNDTLLATGRGRVGCMGLWGGAAHGWRAPVVHDSARNSQSWGRLWSQGQAGCCPGCVFPCTLSVPIFKAGGLCKGPASSPDTLG